MFHQVRFAGGTREAACQMRVRAPGDWAVATPGDVSLLGPGNPFIELLDPGEPPDGCWPLT